MKKKISFQFSPTTDDDDADDDAHDDDDSPSPRGREEKKDNEKKKEKEEEGDYDEESTNAWIREKVAESLDSVAGTTSSDADADADDDDDDDPTVKYSKLLNFYFQWKSLYDNECREMKIALYNDIINKRSSSQTSSSSSSSSSSSFSSRKMNKCERRMYTEQIKNFQCPCLRCGAHEGMYFRKEIFRKGRIPFQKKEEDQDRDGASPTKKEKEKEKEKKKNEKKEKKKKSKSTGDDDDDNDDDDNNDEMNEDLAAMYDRTFQWPNTYIYKAGCSNKKKPCFQVELYSGELATFHDLHLEKAKEHVQIQHDIVVLKLDTIFQYLKSNQCLALFAKKKQAYDEIHMTYEGCQSTVEHLLAKDKDALKPIKKNISAFHEEWNEYMNKFRESKYQTLRDFEHAIHVERILHQEYDQYAHTHCRERNMEIDSEGMMRLTKIPASRPPKHCVLHGDAPKILHSYIKKDPAPKP